MPSPSSWDPTQLKARSPSFSVILIILKPYVRLWQTQIRLAAQRLGQLQDRKDSLAHITSRDIATLLGQRNVSLARTKAQNLMKDDAVSNAMEVLEMFCALVLERFPELEKEYVAIQCV